jgi:hypothetical protein
VLKYGETLRFSATDLANHLGCRHLTALETAAAEGKLKRPMYEDAALDALFERGRRHEQAYVEHRIESALLSKLRSGPTIKNLFTPPDGTTLGDFACSTIRAAP